MTGQQMWESYRRVRSAQHGGREWGSPWRLLPSNVQRAWEWVARTATGKNGDTDG